jgi:hypothetical protein
MKDECLVSFIFPPSSLILQTIGIADRRVSAVIAAIVRSAVSSSAVSVVTPSDKRTAFGAWRRSNAKTAAGATG